jgi:hypothetical protein
LHNLANIVSIILLPYKIICKEVGIENLKTSTLINNAMSNYKIINFYFNLLIASILIFSFSCKDHPDSPIIIPIDPPKVNQIIIGDTTNMNVRVLNYDPTVGYMVGESYYNLDVEGNWKDDIRFYGSRNVLMGLGEWYKVGLSCISDSIKLNTYPFNDTIYISNDTTRYMQNEKLNIYIAKNYICHKKDNNDIFSSITEKSLKCLHLKDTLKILDEFQKDSFEIRKTYPYWPLESSIIFQNKDTIIYKRTNRLTDCHYFSGNDTSYVGFLLKDGIKQKLGWIKILIQEGRETHILETALQK